MKDEKPHVSINEAISWVCLDCGTKNFTEMQLVESEEEKEHFRKLFGDESPDEIRVIPEIVKCFKCSAEWSTCDHDHHTPIEALEGLGASLSTLGDEELGEEAAADIQANALEYSVAVQWALQMLTEMDQEEDTEDFGTTD